MAVDPACAAALTGRPAPAMKPLTTFYHRVRRRHRMPAGFMWTLAATGRW